MPDPSFDPPILTCPRCGGEVDSSAPDDWFCRNVFCGWEDDEPPPSDRATPYCTDPDCGPGVRHDPGSEPPNESCPATRDARGIAPIPCALPLGHAGEHRSKGGTTWAEMNRTVAHKGNKR